MNNSEIKNFTGRIINGFSEIELPKFPDSCIDLVVTSPPYDDLRDYRHTAQFNFDKFKIIAKELYRILKPGGVIVWVVGDAVKDGNKSLTSYRQAIYFQDIGFNMYDVIIYEKAGTSPPHPRRYFNAFEYMFVLSKGKPKTVNLLKDKLNKWGGKSTFGNISRREKDGSLTQKGRKIINKYGVRTNIWKYANGNGFATQDEVAYKHPAIFPEQLVVDHVLSWSNEGDVILDPFGGSGTTAKIAAKLQREWILIESVPEYCEIAKQRLNHD